MRQGRILAGKYRLVTKLTEGGMGMVWRAEHVELGSPAAVKLLDPTIAESSEALARFKREAQSAASLRCTNIVQIFDFGVDEDMPYIAMELLRGKSLAERLRISRRLEPVDTAAILSQVARATSWAHSRGIVHRDLKPGNIFLSEDADDIVVKLLDFGIAKPVHMDLSETPVTLTGAIMGTPQYMSPEQASGKKQVDHRTDIWSFGIIAFECLLGRHAFHADTLGGLVLAICTEPLPIPSKFGEVPVGFDEWFARAAHRDPEQRFASIAEAADALRFVCGVETNSTNRVSTFNGTLEGEVRAFATPTRGTPISAMNLRWTGNSEQTTTLRNLLFPRNRRNQALLIFGVLVVAATAVGSFMRFGGTRRAEAHDKAAPENSPSVTSGNSAVPTPAGSVTAPQGPSPSISAIETNPPVATATPPSKEPPVRKPTGPARPLPMVKPQPSSNAPSPSPEASVVRQQGLVPSATKCDPKTNKLGFCPPPGNK
jgi:serine/threonine protein kinase